MQVKSLALLFPFLLMAASDSEAACSPLARTSLGTGVAGQIQMSVSNGTTFNKLMYCDGTNWQDFPGSVTATPCTKNGEIRFSGGKAQYCNLNVYWDFDSSSVTDGSCSSNGQIGWDSANSVVTFCNGTSKRVVQKVDTEPDPFSFTNATEESEAVGNSIIRIRGITPTNANVSFVTGNCTTANVRSCTDAGCSAILGSRTTNGTLPVETGMTLRAAAFSGPNEGDTCSITVAIGSQSSTFTITTGADSNPSYSSTFGDSLGVTQNAVVESNIVRLSGFTGSVTATISDSTFGGTPEFRTCSDASCGTELTTWSSSSRAVTNPTWVQMRVTMGGALSFRRVTFQVGTGGPTTWWASNATCPFVANPSPGASQTCSCAANYPVSIGVLNGVGNYKVGGPTCRAAVHAGRVTQAAGGTVTYIGTTAGTPSGTCPSFGSSNANGATSSAGTSGASFYFSGGTDVCN